MYLIQDAFIIAIVTYSVTVSLVKVFAREHDYTFDNNQVSLYLKLLSVFIGLNINTSSLLTIPLQWPSWFPFWPNP